MHISKEENIADHTEQTSQVNGFSAFLCMGRLKKNPGPLKFFLKYTSDYLWAWASLVAQLVKNLPAMWKNWVRSLGWEDPLKKGKNIPVFWPREFHGAVHGVADVDMTERLSLSMGSVFNCQVSNCSGLQLNPCRTGWWAMLFGLAILIFLCPQNKELYLGSGELQLGRHSLG